VLDYLAERFPRIAREVWAERMAGGRVRDERGAAIGPGAEYRPGRVVCYQREVDADDEPRIPFEARILWRDEHLLVADKPHFLPVVPAGRFLRETLLARVREELLREAGQLREARELREAVGLNGGVPTDEERDRVRAARDLVPLHRIDRETAGLVLFSVNGASRGLYVQLFARREVQKQYEAIAGALPAEVLGGDGLLECGDAAVRGGAISREFPIVRRSRLVEGVPFFRMREAEGAAANSETRIVGAEPWAESSADRENDLHPRDLYRYTLEPVTGKKHQLRVHMAALGIPILNDRLYPELREDPSNPESDANPLNLAAASVPDYSRPLKLLAKSVRFRDPITGEERRFESAREL
jgi:tRNA pseudouridine32 synthase/23S rRNA pseudouridine746 synthase